MNPRSRTKKVIIAFPQELLRRIAEATPYLSKEFIRKNGTLNLGKFIRAAVQLFLDAHKKKPLEIALTEGYRVNSAFDQRTCEEFRYV